MDFASCLCFSQWTWTTHWIMCVVNKMGGGERAEVIPVSGQLMCSVNWRGIAIQFPLHSMITPLHTTMWLYSKGPPKPYLRVYVNNLIRNQQPPPSKCRLDWIWKRAPHGQWKTINERRKKLTTTLDSIKCSRLRRKTHTKIKASEKSLYRKYFRVSWICRVYLIYFISQ